jgi:hypothetical protein
MGEDEQETVEVGYILATSHLTLHPAKRKDVSTCSKGPNQVRKLKRETGSKGRMCMK